MHNQPPPYQMFPYQFKPLGSAGSFVLSRSQRPAPLKRQHENSKMKVLVGEPRPAPAAAGHGDGFERAERLLCLDGPMLPGRGWRRNYEEQMSVGDYPSDVLLHAC